MNPQGILTVIGGCIGVLTFLGVVVVYLRGSADKGTIASLKGSVEALQIEGKIKDEKIVNLEKGKLDQGATIAHLTAELKTLRNIVTNADEVRAINVLLSEHHLDSMKKLNEIERVFTRARRGAPEAK